VSQPSIHHEMLIANAGSGKTFRLTVRTITLLALGVKPGKIAALTFTRKAAGEFLSAVFLRLARAGSDPAELHALRRDTGLSALSATSCRAILAQLTGEMHRLCMGTIDSLFGRIARSFPLETGLPGDFSVLGDTALKSASRETLATVFRERGDDEDRFAAFLDLLRQQSRNESERQVFDTLLRSVQDWHETYLSTPPDVTWGDASTIWPDGSAILEAGDITSAADALWLAIIATHPNLDAAGMEGWQATLQAVRESSSQKNWSKEVRAFVSRKCSIDSETGSEYFPTKRTKAARVYLNDQVCAAKMAVVHALLKPRLEELVRRSRALHGVLAAFESTYQTRVRKEGRLTFDDITAVLAGQVDSPEWRAAVGYRLDGRFDHWLLDEFQDTSGLQWKVLHGLVDEVIQDTEGTRSFFYVGDTKQAIYSWRGGDHRLFFEIQRSYNQGGVEQIRRADPLDVSFRSDPEVIDVVNRVFGNLAYLADDLQLPRRTVADWTQAWVSHSVAAQNAGNVGYVRWQPVGKGDDEENSSPEDREIARVLLEVRPWERGWSCVALKRTNKAVVALSTFLQMHGIPVAVEGRANPCTDNPLGAALLAAFRLVASPEDSLSLVLLLCSPLCQRWLADGQFAFRDLALRKIASDGFAGLTLEWLKQLELENEPFLTLRGRDFVTAATHFDHARQASDDIGRFVDHIANYQQQEPEGNGVVRIMTIHQAKGMTLDMTIVSGLEDPFTSDKATGSLALAKNRHGKDWGLLLPGSDLSKIDPILDMARANLLADSAYEELCAAYVAMTRPRHGLYLVTREISETSTAKNLARLLALTLGHTQSGFELGNREWYLARDITEATATSQPEIRHSLPRPLYGTPQSLGPAKAENSAPGQVAGSANALKIGVEVHSALAKVEWLETFLPAFPEISAPARMIVERFLASSDGRSLFIQPTTPAVLWRERAFECLLDGKWVAGVFDRVLIHLDEQSKPTAAELVDFKTDKVDDAVVQKRHAGQIGTYRRAAALLIGIDESKVTGRAVRIG